MPPSNTHPAVCAISLQEGGSAEGEEDRSLIYSFCLDPRSAPLLNSYKGLALAVRGVLSSICGQQARTIRLSQREGTDVVLAFTHLKSCMLVAALPGSLLDDQACQLVLQLAQTLVLVAGPPGLWLIPDLSVGTHQPSELKATVKVLLDSICLGVLTQLQGPGLNFALPGLVLEGAVPHLSLPAQQLHKINDLLQAHQDGDVRSLHLAGSLVHMPPGFCFYQRHCCLMFRGHVIWSGLGPFHTKLLWQLCWSLQMFGLQETQQGTVQQRKQEQIGQGGGSPCQVTIHPIHTLAAGLHDQAGATHSQSTVDGRSLLLLASLKDKSSSNNNNNNNSGSDGGNAGEDASGGGAGSGVLVLAVLLGLYEDVDRSTEEAVGKVEGQAAATLLAHIHTCHLQHQMHAASGARLSVLQPPTFKAETRADSEPAVIVYDAEQGSFSVQHQGALGDLAGDEEEGIWEAVTSCHWYTHAGEGQHKQTAKSPDHCRLRLTVGQVEQLSGARAPRDKGQRLGSADPGPWQQHPELATLASVQQVTVQVKPSKAHKEIELTGNTGLLVTGCLVEEGRYEAFIVHPRHVSAPEAIAFLHCNLLGKSLR